MSPIRDPTDRKLFFLSMCHRPFTAYTLKEWSASLSLVTEFKITSQTKGLTVHSKQT